MRIKMLLVASALLLSSCAGTSFIPTKTVAKFIKPEDTYLHCDLIGTMPDYRTLKDTEVAELLNQLYADNKVCKNNMDALKQFYSIGDQIFKQSETNKAPKQ